jgi:hypothetical protein
MADDTPCDCVVRSTIATSPTFFIALFCEDSYYTVEADIMSTLEYLDPHGTVNFSLVSWKTLNVWLSSLNGVPNLEELP